MRGVVTVGTHLLQPLRGVALGVLQLLAVALGVHLGALKPPPQLLCGAGMLQDQTKRTSFQVSCGRRFGEFDALLWIWSGQELDP